MKAKILEIDVPKLIVLRTDPIPEVGIDQPTITRVHRMRRAVAIAVTASAKATRASWGRLCPP
jgi:hypothetical protein